MAAWLWGWQCDKDCWQVDCNGNEVGNGWQASNGDGNKEGNGDSNEGGGGQLGQWQRWQEQL
jgi:hypothetical protein